MRREISGMATAVGRGALNSGADLSGVALKYDASAPARTERRKIFDLDWGLAREFDTWRVILGGFGAIVLRNQALRKAARNCLYWQT